MNRIACGIVQDLLKSYLDGLTGDSVTAMIEEHLASCELCKQKYEEIKLLRLEAAETEAFQDRLFVEKVKDIRAYGIGVCIGLMIPVAWVILRCSLGMLVFLFE